MIEKQRTVLFFSFWLLAMGLMAAQIEKHLFYLQPSKQTNDPLTLLLGSAKEAIGDTFFLKASSYFHGGVDVDLIKREEVFGHEEREGEGLDPDEFKKSYTDWVYKINSRIKITEHRHLQGEETKEILPFLSAAVKLDPYNVTAILTTAFWLESYFKKADAAIEVLTQGLKDNPDSWELRYHLGLNYFKNKKNYAESAGYFEEALAKMDTENSSAFDRRDAVYYLAESYLNEGLKNKALEEYKKALTYFGETENLSVAAAIRDKIRGLSE